jgi:hypothetical protein
MHHLPRLRRTEKAKSEGDWGQTKLGRNPGWLSLNISKSFTIASDDISRLITSAVSTMKLRWLNAASPRLSTGQIAYHVLNRRVGRLELFDKPADYSSFEEILPEAHQSFGVHIAAYKSERCVGVRRCEMRQPLDS